MKASFYGHLDAVNTLIEAGANVNRSNNVSVCALLLYFISAHTVFCNVHDVKNRFLQPHIIK